ncbi:MAG: hypothetical protein EOM54_10880 [Clostridia bacterium]|nr:hypothetical protein [Clostridia bacterium]
MFLTDAIDRNQDVIRFCTILNSVEGPCSIALDGKWGSGKTFFVKQVKMLIDAYNGCICNPIEEEDVAQIKQKASLHKQGKDSDLELQPQVSVYYDAWANDNDEDPILSLIYAIVQSADCNFEVSNKRKFRDVVGSIGDLFTGRNVTDFLEAVKGNDPMEALKENESIHELMAEFFNSLLLEHGNRLIIFIDELDRCKPSYAVRLLERIKHYFEDDRVTFVFSINTEQLQHTIKRFYGEGFCSSRYLNRFFDLRMSLPQANLGKFYQRIAFNDGRFIYDKICHMVLDAYQFELREIAKFVHLAKISAYKPTHDGRFNAGFSDEQAIGYSLHYIIPIMIGLKICDENAYTEFVNGGNSTPLLEIFKMDSRDYFHKNALLRSNETYDPNYFKEGVVCVTPESKIEEVYHALFVQDYNGRTREVYIGDLEFNSETRDIIKRTVSLLSDFADYS